MPVIPLDVDDEVLYTIRKVYLSRDTSVTIQSRLDFWGTVFFNGSPIANIGAIPMASQAQAEAGTDNTTVMSPLRTKQAIDAQIVPTNILRNTVFDAKGDVIVGVADNNSIRLPVGPDGQILSADSSQTGGLKWIAAVGGVTDGDKGDIVVSGSGTSWLFDSSVVSPFIKTLLDDATSSTARTTLGLIIGTQIQAFDADLAAIAGLTPTTDNILQSVAGSWASRTPAQVKSSLVIVQGDIPNLTTDLAGKAAKAGDTFTGNVVLTNPAQLQGSSDLALTTVGPGNTLKLMTNGSSRLLLFDTNAGFTVPLFLPADPTNPLEAATKQYVDSHSGGGGAGVTDGDKGDIVVSASGAVWMLDSSVVTPFAKTFLDDVDAATMLTTIGAQPAHNDLTTLIARWTGRSASLGDALSFVESTGAGTDGLTLIAPPSIAAPATITLPATAGTLALVTDLAPNVTDGDKGDIVVSGGVWSLDSAVVTAAAKTVLDDTTVAAMRNTLGAFSKGGGSLTGGITIQSAFPVITFMDSAGAVTYGFIYGDATSMYFDATLALVSSIAGVPKFEVGPLLNTSSVPILLPADPTAALQAATKQYVDMFLPLTGGALTGNLDLATGDISVLSGDIISGGLLSSYNISTAGPITSGTQVSITSATPTQVQHATRKDYVDTKSPLRFTLNAQIGTAYTLVLTDEAKLVTHNNAAAITVTVPPNSSVAFPVGSSVNLVQLGAGKVTVAPGAGVTVNATPSLGFRAQYSTATLIKTATDTWLLVGDLA